MGEMERAMATSDLRALGTFASYNLKLPSAPTLSSSKTCISLFMGEPKNLAITAKWQQKEPFELDKRSKHCCCFAVTEDELSTTTMNQDSDGSFFNAINISFFERLSLAWRILFPAPRERRNSNAKIAKQRLKMILFSDRCAVSDEAKQKIVSNIVQALSDFVEIDSQDKVQLSFSNDPDHGTVYSVTIPVRHVKPEYHEFNREFRGMRSIEYKDPGEASDSIDVKVQFLYSK